MSYDRLGPPQDDPPWLGRHRLLYTLPLNGQPPLPIRPAEVIKDGDGRYPADTNQNLLGNNRGIEALWIARLLTARPTEDTRRTTIG